LLVPPPRGRTDDLAVPAAGTPIKQSWGGLRGWLLTGRAPRHAHTANASRLDRHVVPRYDCARPVADARRSRRRYAGDEVRRRAPDPSPTGGAMAPRNRQAVSRRPPSPPWGRAWARSPCLPGESTAPWSAAATHGPIGSTAPEPFQTSVRGGPAVPPPTRT